MRILISLLGLTLLAACSEKTDMPASADSDEDLNRQVIERWTQCEYNCRGLQLIAEHEVTVIRNGKEVKELWLDTLLLNESIVFTRDSSREWEFTAVIDTGGQRLASFWHEKRLLRAGFNTNLTLIGLEQSYLYSWQSYSPMGSGQYGHAVAGSDLAVSAIETGHFIITDTTVLRANFAYERQAFGTLYERSGTTHQSGVHAMMVAFTPDARIELEFR